MLYNYGAAILRAVGDTKRPLIFLVISGVVNAVLNLILVIMFHMDVAGVAIATVISQVNFLHSGTQMSAYIENQLPASFWKIKDQYCLLKTDFPGWDSGRDPEHSH